MSTQVTAAMVKDLRERTQAGRYRVVAITGEGEPLPRRHLVLPDATAPELACSRLVVLSGEFANRWSVRVFVLDPAYTLRRVSTARLALRLQGDTRKTVVEFRKHFGWYTKGLHGSSELRGRLFQVESMAEAEAIFGEYLAPVAGVA